MDKLKMKTKFLLRDYKDIKREYEEQGLIPPTLEEFQEKRREQERARLHSIGRIPDA